MLHYHRDISTRDIYDDSSMAQQLTSVPHYGSEGGRCSCRSSDSFMIGWNKNCF